MSINTSRLHQSLIRYLKIDSESTNELAMAQTLAEDLGHLGFEVTKQEVDPAISNAFNIYARLKGQLPGNILFSCHMDTVSPGNGIEPIIEDGVMRSKGDTILGADDKSGIAAILEAITSVQETEMPHQSIEVAFTVHEEGGLHGSKAFDLSPIQSQQAVVLDSGGPIGTIITQAPGQQSLTVTIKGKPAHAGLAPEQGINALSVAARAIDSMKLGRIDEETTSNIGVVNGGQATNVVMPELVLKAEARSLDNAKLEQQVAHMQQGFMDAANAFGAECVIDTVPSYGAYQLADDHPLVESVSKAFAAIGIQAQTGPTGGGSDANIFNQRGIPTVNLSTGMSKVHTTEEFIVLEDLNRITEFVRAYITQE
ncbi:M20/M25/M40 family metallo-hydrolase [Paraferrimonas sedimenticola]|uniref:Peptidase M20 n=1 Tax=Paraferrimonas sedimenticola TaxID=375674 RepID=A0AA37RX76_9GAMM|nr:M20/M25/M40 family metallo-hydrolase [Paraferrimonas sedimenticola]GLP96554.1 peptidase M20 [Paraferrimonas sedimenticola]